VVNCFQGLKQMTTEERNEEQRENELRAMRAGAEALAKVHERISPRFRRAEVPLVEPSVLSVWQVSV
jgi:hypothetical protein